LWQRPFGLLWLLAVWWWRQWPLSSADLAASGGPRWRKLAGAFLRLAVAICTHLGDLVGLWTPEKQAIAGHFRPLFSAVGVNILTKHRNPVNQKERAFAGISGFSSDLACLCALGNFSQGVYLPTF